jgi:hypothetical protein
LLVAAAALVIAAVPLVQATDFNVTSTAGVLCDWTV